ncbi:MAG: YggS family pyridoxal phosphate-dependent enzyme [Endomicrobium sp.]|jgi:pyridoxal phosphate enzyme (YggS family)|nr:YggS family pyridoxal phosphate-dependent enzyme [Endomicrobium sp.]
MKNICGNIKFIKDTVNSIRSAFVNVDIVVVTKTFPYHCVLEVLKYGITDIGENKIQEALPKFSQLGLSLNGVTRHFIGHLQSNKAKKAVENFDLIHSLDSIKLANDIGCCAANINKVQNCLIEVKVSQESSKFGIVPENVKKFYKQCQLIQNILVKGLMVIAPVHCATDFEDSRSCFKRVRDLFEDIKESFSNPDFAILSMGMSGDYKIAVEEGSTMIRIGSAILGERNLWK